MTIERMLVLSTGNLTERTCNHFLPDMCSTLPLGIIPWEKGDYGWFICVPMYKDVVKADVPEDLGACMKLAYDESCNWIMFDRDADGSAHDLPYYDW